MREGREAKRRCLQKSTSSTPPGSSDSGGPSTGVSSAPTGPSLGVVDSPVVVPVELDQPGPSGVSTEEVGAGDGTTAIKLVGPSASHKKLGELGDLA